MKTFLNYTFYLSFFFFCSVIDEILEHHYNKAELNADSTKSYYFYKATLGKYVRKFQAKNHNLSTSHWKSLFKESFSNIRVLNLSLSCNDSILQLIPKYCPHLEYLNATCKYERMRYCGSNAMSFSLPVSDVGLGYLKECKKLKMLIINEARSQGRGLSNTITHDGLRQLIRNVETLENINYSDSGAVIAKNLFDLESINLKMIRHFNATAESLHEIFRLCCNLDELYLTFFHFEIRPDVLSEIISAKLRLRALEVHNLNFDDRFTEFFTHIGSSLTCLSVLNSYECITFEKLQIIAKLCPNLTYLGAARINNADETTIVKSANLNQFPYLESLYLSGQNMNIENILRFCTENSPHLDYIKISERSNAANVDHIFGKVINPKALKHLEVSPLLEFSKTGIRKVIERYPDLKHLNVFCPEDCSDIQQEMQQQNYEFTFINKNDRTFLE